MKYNKVLCATSSCCYCCIFIGWPATWMSNNSFIVMGQAGPIDLLRGRVWERRSVDGPIPWPLSLNITHCVCKREGPLTVAPFHYGSIVSLTNVFFSTSQPRRVHLDLALSFPCVCIDWAYLLWGALTFTCLPQLPAAAVVTQGACVCVHIGMNCVQNTRGPCLFYLVWRVVVLQNKRAQVEALLCEWASQFIFISVWK